MKTLLSLFLILSLISAIDIQAQPNFQWVKQFGGSSVDEGSSVCIDKDGNVLFVGRFIDTARVDTGNGYIDFVSNGSFDVLIQKLDPNGNVIWVKSVGGPSFDGGNSITSDNDGNILVTGFYSDTTDFDPGPGTYRKGSQGSQDLFILKLDSNGNFLWANVIGGRLNEIGKSIITDAHKNIFVSGNFTSTSVDFDARGGAEILSSQGGWDMFLLKLDQAGNFIWVKQTRGDNADEAYDMDIDDQGNIITCGQFWTNADFDPGPDTVEFITPGFYDAFIQKLDSNGNFEWAAQFGGSNYNRAGGVTSDMNGNIYSTGYFFGTSDFDPGQGVLNLTSNGSYDIFVHKLDSAGKLKWVKQIGGVNHDWGVSISSDQFANLYVSGYFIDTVDFDPGPGVNELSAPTGYGVFIMKLDSSGNHLWAKVIDGPGNDQAYSIAYQAGSIYTAGRFADSVDFDPGVGAQTLKANGIWDAFLLKLSQCAPTSITDSVTACRSYTWIDGNTYISSTNSVSYVMSSQGGCDSTIYLALQINNVSDTTLSISNNQLTANNQNASYQWLDCNNSFSPIAGETNRSFNASSNGSYAVELSENNCIDTSRCITVTGVIVQENSSASEINVFPNPSNGTFRLQSSETQEILRLKVFNSTGQVVYEEKFSGKKFHEIILNEPPGVYLMFVDGNHVNDRFQLILY